MSANNIILSTVKPNVENVNLQQDENGYYYVTLGAVNAFNESGAFYLLEGTKELLEDPNGSLIRRLTRGYLKGEVEHPKWEAHMSANDYILRNQIIDKDRVSHSIRALELVPTGKPSGGPGGGELVLIKGWVKPSGARGAELKADLDDPDCNVAFSIRCFTNDVRVGGILTKKIVQIITFDWVTEPGIRKANKYSTLSKESLINSSIEHLSIDISKIKDLEDYCISKTIYSNESSDIITSLEELRLNTVSKNVVIEGNSTLSKW